MKRKTIQYDRFNDMYHLNIPERIGHNPTLESVMYNTYTESPVKVPKNKFKQYMLYLGRVL